MVVARGKVLLPKQEINQALAKRKHSRRTGSVFVTVLTGCVTTLSPPPLTFRHARRASPTFMRLAKLLAIAISMLPLSSPAIATSPSMLNFPSRAFEATSFLAISSIAFSCIVLA
jgi:hypothetical protein